MIKSVTWGPVSQLSSCLDSCSHDLCATCVQPLRNSSSEGAASGGTLLMGTKIGGCRLARVQEGKCRREVGGELQFFH